MPNNQQRFNIENSPQSIFEKTFKVKKIGGYDSNEVDEYLDTIIRDYETFGEELTNLKNENKRLLEQIDELNDQLNADKNVRETSNTNVSGGSTYDILKRISNLEKHVFGNS